MPISNSLTRFFSITIIAILGLTSSPDLYAQERTNATVKDIEVEKPKSKQKRIRYMIKFNSKGILYGNKCFEEVTRDMGFQYLIQPKGQRGSKSGLGRNLHNFGVKFVLVFTQGPFYGIKLNKKKKECRKRSGDYTG